MQELRSHIVILRPSVFPACIKWTIAPIARLLLQVFDRFQKLNMKLEIELAEAFYLLELLAVLERVLAYAFTGSGKVFLRKLMDPLWITKSVLSGYLPALNPRIVDIYNGTQNTTYSIHYAQWPTTITGQPLLASLRTIELTYGIPMRNVSC
jgi:hypothetical protein